METRHGSRNVCPNYLRRHAHCLVTKHFFFIGFGSGRPHPVLPIQRSRRHKHKPMHSCKTPRRTYCDIKRAQWTMNRPKIIIFIGPLLCTTSASNFYFRFHDGCANIGSAMHKWGAFMFVWALNASYCVRTYKWIFSLIDRWATCCDLMKMKAKQKKAKRPDVVHQYVIHAFSSRHISAHVARV